ncbi:phage tail tape measure protein [Streptomyces sp. NPDC059447]|uniref:phage tail tape measure protein n=1 Tax=Streptomyces sp. NPDC059447 TaxID=3346834 RepID=UPI0036BC53F3
MADRTVSVLLTGVVTPYVSAMREAARAAQAAGRDIDRAMTLAAVNSQAAITAMGRGIERTASRAAARVGAAFSAVQAAAGSAASWTAQRWSAASAAIAARWSTVSASLSSVMASIGAAAGTAASWVSARWTQAAAAVASRWPAALAVVSSAAAAASTAAGTAASWIGARWTQVSVAVASRWAAASAAVSTAASAAGVAAGTAAGWIASRWAAASAAVAARWAATSAAVSSAAAATSAAAGSAASWIAARWTAAATAVSGAWSAIRLAAYAAGASILGVANEGRKSLEAMRVVSLALVGVFGLAAFAAARFDKAMSEVRAVTDGSAGDMKKLSQAALDAGQATIYSATQAANAEAELARAGISTADIIGGALKGALDLAASGQLELGESAIISAQAMNAFKLKGQDVGHIADVISAGAGKSATNVHHMGMAFRQAALLASQTGLSLEDTVGTLSLFAQNALTGSDAGTSLKVMLQRLVPQSGEAAAAMEAIGFSAYDASGNFIGLHALAGMMKDSFSKLTPEARNAAMATIFGSDAVRAATILYEAGSEGVDQWVNSVNDAGYATRVAATMTDNLSGDLERLKGALETALISSGSSANKMLREMAQALTSVVNWYSQLSPSVQTSVTIMAGLVGVVGFLGTSLLLMLPRIMAVRAELIALGVTAARVRTAMLAFGTLTVALAGLAAINYGVEKLTQRFREAPPDIAKMTNAMTDFALKGKATGELSKTFGENLDGIGEAAKRLAHPGTLDRIGDALYTITHFGGDDEGLVKARNQMKALDESLASLVQSGNPELAAKGFARMAAEAEAQGTSTDKLRTLLPQYSNALTQTDTQTKLAADSQKQLSDATAITADQMADTRSAAEKLKDTLAALNGVAISAAEKEISFRASLADLTETVKENGYSLDVTTEKGRKVKGAFLDAASAALAHAEATAQQQNSVESGNAVLEQDIAILRRQMEQAGFSKKAIDDLLNAYAKIPLTAETKVGAPGATQATAEMEALRQKIAATPPGKSITVTAPSASAIAELQKIGYKVETLPDGRVKITVPTGGAEQALDSLQARINRMHGTEIDIVTHYRTTGSPYAPSGGRANREANGGYIRGYATGGSILGFPSGGAVFGPGTPTSDSVPAWLSTGEYVIKASSVRRYGLSMMDQLNAGRMPTTGYTARPAGRFGPAGPGDQPAPQVTKHYTINLYGSKQTSAEQAAEIQRHLAFTT